MDHLGGWNMVLKFEAEEHSIWGREGEHDREKESDEKEMKYRRKKL